MTLSRRLMARIATPRSRPLASSSALLSRVSRDASRVSRRSLCRTVPRTRGVSTTDLVGRMLLMTKEHFTEQESLKNDSGAIKEFQSQAQSPHTRLTQFIPSSRQIVQFAEGREPKPDDKIVYVDGAFDLFRTRRSLSRLVSCAHTSTVQTWDTLACSKRPRLSVTT